jgi:protein-ribulosamine 3-kinase
MHSEQLPVSTLPARVREGINQMLGQKVGPGIVITDFKIIAGGCINHGGIIETAFGNFFIKWNDVRSFPKMFELEAKGLSLLRDCQSIRVPLVIGVGEIDSYQFMIIELVESKSKSESYWQDFGHQLARVHQTTQEQFGLDHDNYIGSLRQPNLLNSSWVDFFIQQRLSSQVMLAEKSGVADHDLRKKFDTLFAKLPELLPKGKPALLHGDLWSGNLIVDELGAPCLIDPAVYYGDPEIEIAYTKLFGGFTQQFYDAYQEVNPLAPGFEDRLDIYHLYPLLVHTNLFGQSYLSQVTAILDRLI